MDGGTPTKEEEEKVKSEKRIGFGFVSAELELVALTDGRQKLIWPFGYFVFAFVALFCFYIFLLSTPVCFECITLTSYHIFKCK